MSVKRKIKTFSLNTNLIYLWNELDNKSEFINFCLEQLTKSKKLQDKFLSEVVIEKPKITKTKKVIQTPTFTKRILVSETNTNNEPKEVHTNTKTPLKDQEIPKGNINPVISNNDISGFDDWDID